MPALGLAAVAALVALAAVVSSRRKATVALAVLAFAPLLLIILSIYLASHST
jgi:hypothetical protein